MSFTGEVVVITGASEGIGRALALELAVQRPSGCWPKVMDNIAKKAIATGK